MADVFEVLTASESEQSIAKKAAADTLNAAIYDVRERFGEHLFIAKSKDEFHDRLALCKDDMMKTVNAHLMPVTGVMRRVCKTMEREWRERTANRPLHEIARDIKTNWPKVNYAAQPYLDALHELESVDDMYYQDPASHIVNYFLANAGTWRGPEAKRIKDELKGLVSRRANRLAYSDEELEAYKDTVSSDEKPPRPKAKPFPDTDGEWKKADNTGPVQSLDQTYSPSDGPLVPEGDFHAYQNSVDQNAEATVSGNFTPGGDSGKQARRRYAEDGPTSDSVNLMPPGFNMPFNGVGSPDIITGMPDTQPGQGQYGVDAPASVDAAMRGAARRNANEMMGYPAPATGSSDPQAFQAMPPAPGMDPSTGGNAGMVPAPPGTGGSGPEMMTAAIIKRYAQWCVSNLARPSVRTMEYYAANRPDLDYFVLTAALQKHAEVPGMAPAPQPVGNYGGPDGSFQPMPLNPLPGPAPRGREPFERQAPTAPNPLSGAEAGVSVASRRTAAGKGKDYLMQADEAITNLLNEKAEEFQESITPLQQALQTIQYAEQVQQAQNPMGVMPPAGTVNVMPQTQGPAGPAPAGVDPSGQVDPAMLAQLMGMGGGDPSQVDPNAGIPPAAAGQGAVPPEMQMQARRRVARACPSCGPDHPLERDNDAPGGWPGDEKCRNCNGVLEGSYWIQNDEQRRNVKEMNRGRHHEGRYSSRRRAQVSLSDVRIEDREAGLCSGTHPDGHRVMFQASPEDMKDLLHVMQGDLAQNFSGVSVDEEDIVDHGGHHEARRRYAGDDKSWTDERMRWENSHPEWKPFKEDEDSQRRQNQRDKEARHTARRRYASQTADLIAEYESTPHDDVKSFELEEAIHRLAEQGDPEALAFLNGHDEQAHDAEGHDYPPMGHMARRRTAMPMTEDGYVEGDGWIPGEDFDPHDPDEMEVMEHVWAQEKHDRMRQLEEENEMLRGIVHGKEGAVSELGYPEPEEGFEENHKKVNKENGWPEPKPRSSEKRGGRGKARGAARPQSRGRTASGDLGHCQMGSGCGNQADLTLPLRLLGDVPFCRGCAERYVRVKDRYRKETQEKNRAQQKSGGILEEWQKWQQRRSQSGKLGIGGDKDIEDFAAERGYGSRGVAQLRKHLYGQRNGWYQSYGERKKALRKQAWSGWGPSQVKRNHAVDGWDWDTRLSAYVASSPPEHFICKCGSKLAVPGYHNCKCGKIWNSYVIGTGGENRQAAVEKFLCREIAVRDNVIVANRTAKDGGCTCWEGYERVPGTKPCADGSCRKKTSGRDTPAAQPPRRGDSWKYREMTAADEDDSDEWPSEHHPNAGKSTMSKPPADWHHRDRGGKWTA